MTAAHWIELFRRVHPKQEVRMEFRIVTGLNQGDIFQAKNAKLVAGSEGEGYMVLQGTWDLVGGWSNPEGGK